MYESKPSGFQLEGDSEPGSKGEIAAPGSEKPDPEWESREVFLDTLGLVHTALVTQYGLAETEASELEKDLYVWFVRFCMRPGSPPPQQFRALLLVAACRLAREFRRHVGSAARSRKSPKREPPIGGRAIRSTTGARRGSASLEKAGRRVTLAVATQPALFRELLILFLESAPGVEVVGQGSDEDEIARVLIEKGPG